MSASKSGGSIPGTIIKLSSICKPEESNPLKVRVEFGSLERSGKGCMAVATAELAVTVSTANSLETLWVMHYG
jgi:hypothetical protein